MNRGDSVLSIVLACAVFHMAQDEGIRARFEANDRERFIEGCQSDVTFPAKLAAALMAVREAATA